tara:strand:- start:447 stop:716 length:270 start_codon:yes stop_codon:yes gene_type:complete
MLCLPETDSQATTVSIPAHDSELLRGTTHAAKPGLISAAKAAKAAKAAEAAEAAKATEATKAAEAAKLTRSIPLLAALFVLKPWRVEFS